MPIWPRVPRQRVSRWSHLQLLASRRHRASRRSASRRRSPAPRGSSRARLRQPPRPLRCRLPRAPARSSRPARPLRRRAPPRCRGCAAPPHPAPQLGLAPAPAPRRRRPRRKPRCPCLSGCPCLAAARRPHLASPLQPDCGALFPTYRSVRDPCAHSPGPGATRRQSAPPCPWPAGTCGKRLLHGGARQRRRASLRRRPQGEGASVEGNRKSAEGGRGWGRATGGEWAGRGGLEAGGLAWAGASGVVTVTGPCAQEAAGSRAAASPVRSAAAAATRAASSTNLVFVFA